MRTSTNLSSYATILNNNLNTAGSVRLYGNFAIAGQGISGSDIIVYGRTDMSNSASSSVINEAISLIDKIDSLTVWTYTSGTIAGTRFTPGFYYIEGQAQITSNIVFDGPGVYVIKILNNMVLRRQSHPRKRRESVRYLLVDRTRSESIIEYNLWALDRQNKHESRSTCCLWHGRCSTRLYLARFYEYLFMPREWSFSRWFGI